MQAYQERVIAEKSELDERLENLRTFCSGDGFIECVPDERARLWKQHQLMSRLSEVLGERIAAFPPDEAPVTEPVAASAPEVEAVTPTPTPIPQDGGQAGT